jgi:hypothetical protein
MPERIVPLTTEHLRIMRDDIAALGRRVDDGFADLKRRLARVEQSIIGLKRDETKTAAELAEHRHMLDRIDGIIAEPRGRLDKIEADSAH